MKNHEGTKKILSGMLIGTIGAGALYFWYLRSHKKPSIVQKIGRTISEVGEMIENCSTDSNLGRVSHFAETVEKKLPDGVDMLHSISDWISTARSLWKKINK